MSRILLSCLVAFLIAVTSPAAAVPIRGATVTVNDADTVAAQANVFLPPASRYCYAFVRSYLVTPDGETIRVIGRLGKFRLNFRPCFDGEWHSEGVRAQFSDIGRGPRRICFEAWAPMRSGGTSRHYACTAEFTS